MRIENSCTQLYIVPYKMEVNVTERGGEGSAYILDEGAG